MESAGGKLKRTRERLKMTYRDVEEASQIVAASRANDEFVIALSRLSDIENKGVVPTLFRMYSLCAIYRLDISEVLRWYGVPVDSLPADAARIDLDATHPVQFSAASGPGGGATQPAPPADQETDLGATAFLGNLVNRWGKLPFAMLGTLDLKHHRYGFIGMNDWSMCPLVRPGSLVLIDEGRRKIAATGWTSEFDRPIYFLEHRNGYACGWCSVLGEQLIVQPHPAAQCAPSIYRYPVEIEVIGQVIGVVMVLDSKRRRHAPPPATPAKSPSL